MFMRKAIHYFLYTVPSTDDLPAPVSAAVRQHLDAPQMIIVIPPQDYAVRRETRWKKNLPFGWRVTPQRTLAFGDRCIVIVEADRDGSLSTTHIPLDDLVYADLGTILLYGYTHLVWAQGSRLENRYIEYNAVGEHLLRRQLEWVRTNITTPAAVPPGPFDSEPLPFKFHNYLRYNLLPDEQVITAVHQPAIRQSEHWLAPYLSPNRTTAITDRQVLILEEEERRRKSTYGIIVRFVPFDRVQAADFEPENGLIWLRLRVGLGAAAETIHLPLEAARADRLRAAWEALRRVTA